MKRLVLICIMVSMSYGMVQAVEIKLTTPIQDVVIDIVRVDQYTINDWRREMDFRLTIGFEKDGFWVEKKDYHQIIKNIPAIKDNPKTKDVDESASAWPRFDEMMAEVIAGGKTMDRVIFDLPEVKAKFPGIIQ